MKQIYLQNIYILDFRAGSPSSLFEQAASPSVAPSPASPSPAASPAAASVPAGGSLEWWQIPNKYRRLPIDDLEMEAINMGGRDKPFC